MTVLPSGPVPRSHRAAIVTATARPGRYPVPMTASVRPPQVSETALPVRDVAVACNVSERTVRRWVTRDGLSAAKVGHTFWITVSDLEQFRGRGDRGQAGSATVPTPPVRLADNGTSGHADTEAPHLAALVREMMAANVRLSEEVGRLRAEVARHRQRGLVDGMAAARENGAVPETAKPWWRRWLRWS